MKVQFFIMQTSGPDLGQQILMAELALKDGKVVVTKDNSKAQNLGNDILNEPIWDDKNKTELTKENGAEFLKLMPIVYSGTYLRAQLIQE